MRALLAFGLLASSCVSTPQTPIAWTRELIVDYEFTPIDKKHVEWWSFQAKGWVTATLAVGDAMMGPVWDWRIRGGKLQIIDSGRLFDEWTLLRRDAHTVTVRRITGKGMQYNYAKHRRSNQAMQPTASPRTASLLMTNTHSFQACLVVISGG